MATVDDVFKGGVLFTGYLMITRCSAETCAAFSIVKDGNHSFILSEEFLGVFMAVTAFYTKKEKSEPYNTAVLWSQQSAFVSAVNAGFITRVRDGWQLTLKALNYCRQQAHEMRDSDLTVYLESIKRLAIKHDIAKEELQNGIC